MNHSGMTRIPLARRNLDLEIATIELPRGAVELAAALGERAYCDGHDVLVATENLCDIDDFYAFGLETCLYALSLFLSNVDELLDNDTRDDIADALEGQGMRLMYVERGGYWIPVLPYGVTPMVSLRDSHVELIH